jgi:hypothetical protein
MRYVILGIPTPWHNLSSGSQSQQRRKLNVHLLREITDSQF